MAVRGEEVASSIDAHVRESIEKMVGEIHSSIEDVRVVVDQQLKAALQSVQADVNAVSFLPHIRKAIDELQETLAAAQPAAAAVSAGAGVGPLKTAIQTIERGKSQVDILNALLEQCAAFGSRAALLIVRGETFSGWKGVGFTRHGGNDEAVKRFNAAPGLIPELDRLLRNEQVVRWDGTNLSTRLGVGASQSAVLVPMVIKDKVSAAVYVDAVGADVSKLDIDSIELLVYMTGLLVDTLAIRKKIPSPSLSGGEGAGLPFEPAPQPQAQPQSPAPAAPARPAAPALPDIDTGTVAISAAQVREMMTPPPRPPAPAPPASPPPAAPSPASTTKIPATLEPKAPPAAAPSEERATTQYIPPAGLNRGAAADPQNEDAKKHDEARRFARLLVSEIKLYNESKVEQGRRNNDLYERLKEDIDRSRQMYDERIGEDVRKASNYFYDELVRILADGRAQALGL